MPSCNLSRILRYFEAIEEGSGSSSRMAFYQVAGNEDNLRRWEQKLCDEWRLISRLEEDGKGIPQEDRPW